MKKTILFIFATVYITTFQLRAFDGCMTKEELCSYLSKSGTVMGWLGGGGGLFSDNLRMARNTGLKFAGRTLYCWGHESDLARSFTRAKTDVATIHAQLPDLILEGCSYEIITIDVEKVAIPDWVFKEFGKEVVKRNFDFHVIYGTNDINAWGPNESVGDIRQEEYQMWVYFLATNYIDIGLEAMHFGEMQRLMIQPGQADAWWNVLTRIRKYASANARRHLILCNAFDGIGSVVQGDKLIWDFLEYPLRIQEQPATPQDAKIVVGYEDAIFKKTISGNSPMGWYCDRQPYLVEVDNWGESNTPGKCAGYPFVWGYDEISWFALQSEKFRNTWIQYAWKWLKDNDPIGNFEMPFLRCCPPHGSCLSNVYFSANTGYGKQEETIKALWNEGAKSIVTLNSNINFITCP